MRVAIIPARGGSKRMPRKNLVDIGGQPMLTHPISCARDSRLFDEICVSTEDDEIAEVARHWNASVIARPRDLAGDRSTVVQVCLHVLDALAEQGVMVDIFCCIYATAAFITPEDLSASLRLLDDDPKGDVVMGTSVYETHPVKALKREGGYWARMWPEFGGTQSQFYPRLVASNGTLYWARTAAFRAQRTFYVERLKCYDLPRSRAVDIDTPEDLALARRQMHENGMPTVP